MKKLLILPAALALAVAAPFTTFAKDDHSGHAHAEIGKPAPAFTLEGADGKTHSLADAKGKIVVLEWTNPGCPFVQKYYEPGEMQKLQKAAVEKGIVWYRVNSSAPGRDGAQTAKQTAAYEKSNNVAATASLIDPTGEVGHAYNALSTPHLYVIAADGTLAYSGAIDNMPTPNSADIAKAKNYVTQALAEIEAGKPVSEPSTKSYGCSVKYAK